MNKNYEQSFFYFYNMKIYIHPEVYEPAEDTFLLMESIKVKKNQTVLELGAGTGILSLYFTSKGADVICTDINPYAINLISKNITKNQTLLVGTIRVRQGDLFTPIRKDETFDHIVFNPPYLPTTSEQKKEISQHYAKSFDGGPSGLETTTRFIQQLKPYLNINGTATFITSSFSDIYTLKNIIEKFGYHHTILNSIRCDDEILTVNQIQFE